MTVKVRLLSKFTRMGASSRLRMLQYFSILKQSDISIDHQPLLSDAYVKALYAGRSYASRTLAARHYVSRICELWRNDTSDLDWVEGEFLPFLPRSFEKAVTRGRPFIAEYDDALFHRYDISPNKALRSLLGDKIDNVMRDAAYVIAGNRYLAEHAQEAGAAKVEIIPTVVDVARYRPVEHGERRQPVIGWIGSPVTQHYLHALHGPLREICARHNALVRLIGARPNVAEHLPGVPLECVPWTEQNEAALLSGVDVGIMPLLDGPWERGKCGYKLVQYMACGLPVLASPIGVNIDLVKSDENGFLPASTGDWIDSLSLLLSDVGVRQRLGAAGRTRVETDLCIEAQAPRLVRIMREVAAR
jgi:glycosyltransferase involved in cell wall biosynthesis